jgi:hypothetical protein
MPLAAALGLGTIIATAALTAGARIIASRQYRHWHRTATAPGTGEK